MRFLTLLGLLGLLIHASTLSACMAPPEKPALYATADGTVVLHNFGSTAISYRGYASDSPTYSFEALIDGTWQDTSMGWCGTGLSEQTLAAGARMQFTVSTDAASDKGKRPCRVVLTIQTGPETHVRLVSNTIRNQEKPEQVKDIRSLPMVSSF
jgi:hypothetical protein